MGRLDITALLTCKEISSREGLLDFENEKYVVSYLLCGQGPASSLNCPAILILEYQSTGNESPIAYAGRWGAGAMYLLPHMFPFKPWFSLDICPGVGLLGHIVVLVLVF